MTKKSDAMTNKNPGSIFCQYSSDSCLEHFPKINKEKVLFLYPSEPKLIASTIENAADTLTKKYSKKEFLTWKNIKTEGKIIFCQICKEIFSSSLVICDITTLNFNVLFEIGFIMGLSKTFIPIFDTSFGNNKLLLTKIGFLDTVGYKQFVNSEDLVKIIEDNVSEEKVHQSSTLDTFKPIYYIKSPIDTDGSLKITASLKKSWFRFRLFDPSEKARLSLNEAIREVDKSRAIVAHLLSPERGEVALIHNARCAFVAGIGMASQKRVLLIQEGKVIHPIDYRDIIKDYEDVNHINLIMDDFFRDLVETLQSPVKSIESVQRSILEDIDIGDTAAENEIENLKTYFIRTGEFTAARRGHAQLIIGRRGSGKTALFYSLRHHIGPERQSTLILDLKPEGYQFAKLNETLLEKFSPSIQQHTVTAIWDYIILLELTHKIINDKNEINISYRNPDRLQLWNKIKDEYRFHRNIEEGDFSERINDLIDKIIERAPKEKKILSTPEITQFVFLHDIKPLRELLVNYLKDKEEVWLLFDNLDKNWLVKKGHEYEVIILQCLLNGCRKLQRMLSKENVNFHSAIFIRDDIYSFFLNKIPDRGKDQVVYLLWEDIEVLKEIFKSRVEMGTEISNNADDVWSNIFDLHVKSQNSFMYLIERTFMRPRDMLTFINHSIQTAINRGHNRVSENDVLHAEKIYSRDLFQSLVNEIRDINPDFENILYCFLETKRNLYKSELIEILQQGGVPNEEMENVIETLLWSCFLGIVTSDFSERYAYSVGYNIKKLLKLSDWVKNENSEIIFSIHPGLKEVLENK